MDDGEKGRVSRKLQGSKLRVHPNPKLYKIESCRVTSDFKGKIALSQSTELKFQETLTAIEKDKLKDFAKGTDGYGNIKAELACWQVMIFEGESWKRHIRATLPFIQA